MNELLDKIKNEIESPVDEVNNEYLERKDDFVIKDDVDYPDPDYLIEIKGVPTLPKGNIVALSAKWKNGKTFFCDILSAVFLGTNNFPGMQSRKTEGKVQIFDTEQAMSDTARIRNIIKELTSEKRNDDFEVFCMRNALIDKFNDDDKEVSRYDFISKAIEHDHPDLVIIDGIADLIYNYNDVIESQLVVNNLASLANRMDCCIVVVMHQNKSKTDKTMKGHLGTMLFQKCSDVFNVEKVSSVFVVTHSVSRHRSCDDVVFKIDLNGIPVDASSDIQMIKENEERSEAEHYKSIVERILMPGEDLKRSVIVDRICSVMGVSTSYGYRKFKELTTRGLIESENGILYHASSSKHDDT